jgi:hypothetical protein
VRLDRLSQTTHHTKYRRSSDAKRPFSGVCLRSPRGSQTVPVADRPADTTNLTCVRTLTRCFLAPKHVGKTFTLGAIFCFFKGVAAPQSVPRAFFHCFFNGRLASELEKDSARSCTVPELEQRVGNVGTTCRCVR